MNKNTFKTISLAAVILTLTYFAFQILKPFIGIVVVAGIVAVFLNPMFKRINRRLSSPLSALVTVLLFFIFLIIPLGLAVTSIIIETTQIVRNIGENPQFFVDVQKSIEEILRSSNIPFDQEIINLREQAMGISANILKSLGGVVFGSFGLIFNIFLFAITLYYLLLNQQIIKKYLLDINLISNKYFLAFEDRAIKIINGTVRGYMVVTLLQGFLAFIALFLFGLPLPFLIGFIYGLSALVPLVGSIIVWLPLSIYLYINQGVGPAILFALWFYVTGLVVDNYITPKLIGRSTQMHHVVVMFSIFGGLGLFGLIGMILGPTLVAMALLAIEFVKDFTLDDKSPKVSV